MPTWRAQIFALLILLFFGQPCWADKAMYVTDRMQVVVRTNPSQEAKAIDHISTGDMATILETNAEGWVRVRTSGGKEGWALQRYFVEEPPAAVRLKDLDPQSKNLAQRLDELKKENLDLKTKLTQAETKSGQAEASFQKLKTDSADVIRLRDECQKTKDDFQQQGQRMEELVTENEALRFGTNLKWFLAGGGVLLIGWIMGLAYGRRKRRWSSGLQ